MRGLDDRHDEHVKMLDALSSNLKSEVARGLRLLDTCVSNIAQAKWILTNVDESLSGFSKGCLVCGTLVEKEKQLIKVGGKEITKPKPASARDRDSTPGKQDNDRVIVMNKQNNVKCSRNFSPSPPRSNTSKPQSVSVHPVPVHRVGPRSKTRLNEPPAFTESIEKPKITAVVSIESKSELGKLPKKLSIVVAQTKVNVQLTNISHYLRGRSTYVDLNDLGGFVSPTQVIPANIKFKPQMITIKPEPPPPRKHGPGPASRKFMESLKATAEKTPTAKPKSITLISSDDEKPKPVTAPPRAAPPPPAPTKKSPSDSGSEYDYNFAKTVPTVSTGNKSKIGSQLTLPKRPRPSMTDSDEDYQYRKKKGSKSIFKKKVSSSDGSPGDSDSDPYDRKKKKKLKRKEFTDKDKLRDKSSSSSCKVESVGDTKSSVISSRMTITLNSSKRKLSKQLKEEKSRRDSGSTVSSLGVAKSETGKPTEDDLTKDSTEVPMLTKTIDSSSVSAPVKYRPGPASRKLKMAQSITAAHTVDPPKAETPVSKIINGEPPPMPEAEMDVTELPSPASTTDPFEILKQQIKNQGAPESQGKPPPSTIAVGPAGLSTLMSSLNTEAKAKLLAKLTQISIKKPDPATVESAATAKPLKASLAALVALAKTKGAIQKVGVVTPPPAPLVPPPILIQTEDDTGIELGDIIDKCIDDIGVDPDLTDKLFETPRSFTFQDCLSPDGTNDGTFFAEPDSASSSTIERIQLQLLKLSSEPFDDAALLHSQDKINELFGPKVNANSLELETYRTDLQEGLWYLVKRQTLGKAACSDIVSVYEWDQVPDSELTDVLKKLEAYTAASLH